MPEDTGRKRGGNPPEEFRFKPGNPGRPKGSRNKLGEAFVAALHDDFMAHGVTVIERVREEKPDQYMKVVASLLPKEFKIETVSELTDEQLDARIRQLAHVIDRVEGRASFASGGGQAPEGSSTLN
jgi:hypothetical protein